MRYRVVKRHNGLHVLDTETGSAEHISATLAGLLDHTKVEPLRARLAVYVDPIPLDESVKRAIEVSRTSWLARRSSKPRQASMPLTTKTLGKGPLKRKRGR